MSVANLEQNADVAERTPWRLPSALPGFGLTFGFTILYLSLIVLLPLTALILRPWELGPSGFWNVISDERVLHALKLSFTGAAIGAGINVVFGLIIAWVMVRYAFPGRKLIDALIDLPFALPTSVAGIALTALFAPNEWIGKFFTPYGLKIAYTPLGVFIALTFIGLPFVVRTVEPVLADLDREHEEAAATLGANRWQTFRNVVFPALAPALITGAALAFARAAGEYGSVVFIAGNLPNVSEIAPLIIIIKLEQFDYAGAAAVGVAMLAVSFVMLLIINLLQSWTSKR